MKLKFRTRILGLSAKYSAGVRSVWYCYFFFFFFFFFFFIVMGSVDGNAHSMHLPLYMAGTYG